MTKAISIVETAYRATLEEQDDTVFWLTHMCATPGSTWPCCCGPTR